MKLRDYQIEVVEKIKNSYRYGNKMPIAVLPTGAGKSQIIAHIVKEAQKKDTPTMIIVHRQELLFQLSLTFCNWGIEHSLVCSSSVASGVKMAQYKSKGRVYVVPNSKVMIASVQTVIRRFDKIRHKPKLLIYDESHHCAQDTMWTKVYEEYSSARGLMLTATPIRLDKKPLFKQMGGIADDLILGPSMSWLIDNGYLNQYKIFTTSRTWDLSNVKTKRNGEYDEKSLANELEGKPTIVGDAISHYKRICNGSIAICYCVSISQSKIIAEQFTQAGIPAGYIDSTLSNDERREVVRKLADGEIKVLCNAQIATEGFDLAAIAQKDVQVQTVINLSPTQSLSLWMQKAGRCLRPIPGKVSYILDHCSDSIRHSIPCSEKNWLELNEICEDGKKPQSERTVSVKTCNECYAIMESKHSECVNCGFIFPIKERVVEEKEGDLVEVDKEALMYQVQAEKKQKRREQGQCQTLQDFLAFARENNYKPGWAHKMFAIRSNQKRNVA